MLKGPLVQARARHASESSEDTKELAWKVIFCVKLTEKKIGNRN